MIEEAYVSFEIAKLLKEKGFHQETPTRYAIDSIIESWYDDYRERVVYFDWQAGYFIGCEDAKHDITGDTISAPTHQMAMSWLREKGIYITIIYGDYPANKKVFWTPQIDSLEGFDLPDSFYQEYDLYEDAVEAALKYTLENLI